MTGFGRWNSQYNSLVSKSAPIETAHVGTLPQSDGFPPAPQLATGWFADWVAEQAQSLAPENADTTVRTTLDARLQANAEARLAALLDGPGAAAGVTQGAVVALDAATGAVHAMVGGRDYRRAPSIVPFSARRQPGSAFKPFVWLAALEKGVPTGRHECSTPRSGSATGARPISSDRYLGEITSRRGARPVDQHRRGAPAAAGRRPARGGEAGVPG